MDTNKMRPIKDAPNIEATGWKSTEHRKMMVKKIADFLVKYGPPSWIQNLSALMKSVERFEEKVFASTRDEAEYIAKISAKMKTIKALPQIAESNLLPPNSSGLVLAEWNRNPYTVYSASREGAEREANIEWQEQIYQRVQTIKSIYFTKLDSLYKQMSSKLQQHETVPQQPKTTDTETYKHHKRVLEYIFALLKVNRSQISPNFKQRLDRVEKYIQSIVQPKKFSSHHQEQHYNDVHTIQQLVPSHSRISQVEISEKKPTLQVSLQSSNLTKQIPQPNKRHLQDHQVANQFICSQQQANQVSIKKGVIGKHSFDNLSISDCGNAGKEQTNGEIKSPEAHVISSPRISASPLLEDRSNLNEISRSPIITSNDSSASMQRLIKVLTSMSTEALMAASGEIGVVVHLNDDISTLELLNGPPKSAIDTNLEGVIHADSQARYSTCNDVDPRGRKMSRFINSMPTSDSFIQFTGAGKPYSNSVTSQENYTLLEEINEINKLLIDTEIVIGEEKNIPSAAEGDVEHCEGLIVKLFFSSVTINVNLMSQYSSNKKSIIKPLWLLVPTSYPLCSPVILDGMPLDISEDLEDLSMKAKLKLRLSLQSLNQPLSLGDIAMSWERCAREAICEYAQLHGGGTFSSKYGGWEISPNAG